MREIAADAHAFLMRLIAPAAGYWRPKIFSDPDNISGPVIRRFLVNSSANFSENEMLQLAEAVGDKELLNHAYNRLLLCWLELGDIQQADTIIAAFAQVAIEIDFHTSDQTR